MGDLAGLCAVAQGRVLGVYYRAFTARIAVALGLTGYVRNLPDNSVEVVAEGERKQLQNLLEQLRQGPPRARVDNLALSWNEYTGQYSDFSVTS